MTNAHEFNAEIKSLAKDRYIENSTYMCKKGKITSHDGDCEKKDNAAVDAYAKDSVFAGSIIFLRKTSLENFSILAGRALKRHLPFHYLVSGHLMRNNIEYELDLAKKQEEMDYKPMYDLTSFR